MVEAALEMAVFPALSLGFPVTMAKAWLVQSTA